MGKFRGGLLLPHPPVLLPEVGGGDSERAVQTRRAVEKAANNLLAQPIDTLLVMTPHAPRFRDAIALFDYPRFCGSLAEFRAPEIQCSLPSDSNLTEQIFRTSKKLALPVARVTSETAANLRWSEKLDHGALVPLSFMIKAGFHGRVALLSPGDLPCTFFEQFGRVVRGIIDQSVGGVAILASGDMSHYVNDASPYGNRPEGALFDAAVQQAIQDNDFLHLTRHAAPIAEAAGECGFRSLCFLFGAAHDCKASLLSYEAPFGIGYAVAAWLP